MIKADSKGIKLAAQTVKQGGIIVYPTDTVYGLGCDPFNVEAVKRIFEAKGREQKPLPILVSSLNKAKELAYFSNKALKLAKNYWPGPITLILKSKDIVPETVTCGLKTVGLRIPDHPAALKLIRLSGGQIIGTSANVSGRKPCVTAETALDELGNQVDLILNGGKTLYRGSSTVLDLSGLKPRILRGGPVAVKELL
jgi:L-threonylcarbamoyladenylate synthase